MYVLIHIIYSSFVYVQLGPHKVIQCHHPCYFWVRPEAGSLLIHIREDMDEDLTPTNQRGSMSLSIREHT